MGSVLVEITPVAKGPRPPKVMLRCCILSSVLGSPGGQSILVIFSIITSSGGI